ncbi:MAG: glycoside hydrolase family 9 protein [Saprospiraceae bacterium]|nr:glycoside hydrolase family 9 protein [Saprospiraceae bacterium]
MRTQILSALILLLIFGQQLLAQQDCTPPALHQVWPDRASAIVIAKSKEGVEKYIVRARRQGEADWPLYFSEADTAVNVLYLEPDTNYEYQLQSSCGDGFSYFSDIRTFRTYGPTNPGGASPLEHWEALTDKVILLKFNEGFVQHHQLGQKGQDDLLFRQPLNTIQAGLTSTYTIFSSTDQNYIAGEPPLLVSRKSKGRAFSSIWPDYPYAQEHYLYLELPYALRRGETYTINLGGMANNRSAVTIIFDEFVERSEAIHVNQIGYVPQANLKYAYVYHWMGDGDGLKLDAYANRPFHLVDEITGNTVFTGQLKKRYDLQTGPDEAYNATESEKGYYGTDVWECDFSTYGTAGRYRLVVEGIGSSFLFDIKEDVYRLPFQTTARGLFHHRSGIERTTAHTDWTKPIDHRPGVNGFKVYYSDWRYMDGSNAFEQLPANATTIEMPEAWGGWMDAGDFDRQNRHMVISNLLMWVYEWVPNNFSDGELNIPESGNGIPDILDEAIWGIDLFRRMKGPTGGISGGIEANEHPRAGEASWSDGLDWYAYAEEPLGSFRYAATATQLAYVLEMAGLPDQSSVWLTEARGAYNWAQQNMREGDEALCRDQRAHAAAWLFRYTGEESFHTQFKSDLVIQSANDHLRTGEYDQELAVWTYVSTEQAAIDQNLKALLEQACLNWADYYNLTSAQTRACRMGFDFWVPTVVGLGSTTPMVMPAIMAYEISGEQAYLDYVRTTCDYYLGGNPLNMTWVTGLGDRSPKEVLNIDSWFDDVEPVIPGIVPYGMYTPAFDDGDTGVWQSGFLKTSCYPEDPTDWPIHELYFESRYTPITNEYTVWQNIGPAAAAYGYLTAKQEITSSVEALGAMESKLFVSPNPGQGWVKVKGVEQIFRLTLFDMRGVPIRSFEALDQLEYTMELADLPTGIYWISAWSRKGWLGGQKWIKR